MSILESKEFDDRVGESGELLVESMATFRTDGLAIVLKDLKDMIGSLDVEGTSESEIADLLFAIQEPLLSGDGEAVGVEDVLAQAQEAIDREARGEAVREFSLDADPDYSDADKRLEASSLTTAGAFLIERDRALAKRISEQAASRLKTSTSEQKIALLKDRASTIERIVDGLGAAWGTTAEERYWTLAANAWLGRARNAGIASAMQDAGLERARIAAEIDERTTIICRLLHGKVITVSSAIATTAGLVEPGTTGNWISVQTGDDLKPQLYLPDGRLLATRSEDHVIGSGEFEMGSYAQYISDDDLAGLLGPPPYHHLCRTILVPEDYKDPLELQADVTIEEPPL